MRVLIACEESQAVCIEFRKRGHEAYSCDLQPCSGGHPEWHIQDDVLIILESFRFYTQNHLEIFIEEWDLIIAHPTCTRLANSGVMWLEKRNLWNDLLKAITFFNSFKNKAPKLAIENPIPHKYAINGFNGHEGIHPYTQIIQPYQFGHPERKATCLWLYGLPQLVETNNVIDKMRRLPKKESQRIHYMPPGPERAKLRSKTYPGIARAMAEQWG